MMWYLIGALTLILFAALVLVPWRADLLLSAEQGFLFKLKLGTVIPVINGQKSWGQLVHVRIMGLKMSAGTSPSGLSGTRWSTVFRVVDIDTVKKITRYFHALAGHTKMKLEISGEFGLGDPALTGVAYGMACSLIGSWGIRKAEITPNFIDPVFNGEIKLVGTFVPLVVITRTIITALHPSVMRVLLALAGFGRVTNSEGGRKVGS